MKADSFEYSSGGEAPALDIYGPLAQARRCLDLWLAEEGRTLPEKYRQRAAALMARYFLHEDEVTDALMMSFLRHYAGLQVIDMDDPETVRMELKTVLDKSVIREPSPSFFSSPVFFIQAAAVFLALAVSIWLLATYPSRTETLNEAQQANLRVKVEKVLELDPALTRAAVWAKVKEPFHVRGYKQIPARDYAKAEKMLDDWIKSLATRTGM